MSGFQGLSQETYRFFWELAFHNNAAFFNENRERYKTVVQQPMQALVQELAPLMQQIDPEFDLRPSAVISRIRRDTRYTRDKTPYRDHVFFAFKHKGKTTGESFVIYAEFEREQYGYGMGMYFSQPAIMREMRERILARPSRFLELAEDPAFAQRFMLQGEDYKRMKMPDADQRLQPWLNKKGFSYCYSCKDLKNTMLPSLVDELKQGYTLLKPMYRFLTGLD